MAGIGFDAAMVDEADSGKERFGMLAYLRAGVREALHREPFTATVTVDGSELFTGAATCVLVGNVGTLKGGVEAFPDASVTDGLLDVAVVTATGLREWASLMVDAVRHRQHASANAQLGQGSAIRVELDGKHRFELDGGAKGTATKLALEVVPASLTVCAPRPTP
jgi:diacylglycerol kinase (ATP)